MYITAAVPNSKNLYIVPWLAVVFWQVKRIKPNYITEINETNVTQSWYKKVTSNLFKKSIQLHTTVLWVVNNSKVWNWYSIWVSICPICLANVALVPARFEYAKNLARAGQSWKIGIWYIPALILVKKHNTVEPHCEGITD